MATRRNPRGNHEFSGTWHHDTRESSRYVKRSREFAIGGPDRDSCKDRIVTYAVSAGPKNGDTSRSPSPGPDPRPLPYDLHRLPVESRTCMVPGVTCELMACRRPLLSREMKTRSPSQGGSESRICCRRVSWMVHVRQDGFSDSTYTTCESAARDTASRPEPSPLSICAHAPDNVASNGIHHAAPDPNRLISGPAACRSVLTRTLP